MFSLRVSPIDVVKRTGAAAPFDIERIRVAIFSAGTAITPIS